MIHYRTIFVALVFLVSGAMGQRGLDSIPAIRQLPPEQAAEGRAVGLEGQIVWVDPLRGSFFLNDGTKGIYVRYRLRADEALDFAPGDVVRVAGRTAAGSFAPEIIPTKVERLGHKPLPEGNEFWLGYLYSPEIDCDWVMVRARIVSFEVLESAYAISVEMIREGQSMFIQVPLGKENEQRLSELLFEWVRFNAVAGTVNNSNRQAVGRIFHVNSAHDFVVEGISLSEALNDVNEAIPIRELMRAGMNHRSIVKTYGVVTYVGEREIFLRGQGAALRVLTHETAGLSMGDRVEVIGLVSPGEVTPEFRAHSVKAVGHEPSPAAVPVASIIDISDRLNFDLVSVEAELVEIGRSFGMVGAENVAEKRIKLLCLTEDRLFEVRLPAGEEVPDKIAVGARLRVTGLLHFARDNWRPWDLDLGGLWLQPRNAADIGIMAPAPWWTTTRLLWIAGIAMGLSALFLGWIVALRRTVERQTNVIGEKVEREAVLNERQRIARELHDNLEQGLAGAIFQLGGLRRLRAAPPPRDEAAEGAVLASVENMLRYCSEESRSSILDLRGGLLERMDLVEAVKATLDSIADARALPYELVVTGTPARFDRVIERNVLLVIKEAALNAARHAEATKLKVVLDFAGGITVTITDDGRGFDLEKAARSGRFGLQGMRERMANIQGSLRVESAEGQGATIVAKVDPTQRGGVDNG